MKTVRIYYAGIPAKNTNPEKRDVLKYFHMGVPAGQSIEEEKMNWQPADLAVMQGWVHANSGRTPHLMFRREIIQRQHSIGKHVLAIDSNLFLYKDPTNSNHYLRFSLNDVFPNSGTYFTNNIIPGRWKQIQKDLDIEVKPWRTDGKHILICLQRNGGWSMRGLDVMQWCNKTIVELQKHTNKKIIVRAHPGDKRSKEYLKIRFPGVRVSTNKNILDDFENCYAVITYNSSPAVAAAIEGIPVFVTDPDPTFSQALDVANTDLSMITNPKTFERQQWLEKIAMCHFNYRDLHTGVAWNIIKDYI